MSAGKISKKQQEILDFLKQEILTKGYPPSVREICEAVNLRSTSSVFTHLGTLEKNGYIRRDPSKPRAIEILDDEFNRSRIDSLTHPEDDSLSSLSASASDESIATETALVPLVGQVAAGQPILAVQNIESYFPIPAEYMPKNDCFMLKVKGESMINAGILNGDIILVEQTPSVRNGEMVVALVDESATVKTFYKEKDFIRLQPENDTMSPIYVKDCRILGKVIGVMRFFR